ncbi:MAG: hypothetical protein RLZZ238_964 [Planctomycetota bacterium]
METSVPIQPLGATNGWFGRGWQTEVIGGLEWWSANKRSDFPMPPRGLIL